MSLYRKSGWLKAACLLGIWFLALGTTFNGATPKRIAIQKPAHGIHVNARFDTSAHAVVEEVSFSDAAGF